MRKENAEGKEEKKRKTGMSVPLLCTLKSV